MKVNKTFDDNRLGFILNSNQTLFFTKNSFFYAKLGCTQSHLGPLGDFKRYMQLIPGSYKSEKPINFTGVDKIHLKRDCMNGYIVNGFLEPLLYSFALDKPRVRNYTNNLVKNF